MWGQGGLGINTCSVWILQGRFARGKSTHWQGTGFAQKGSLWPFVEQGSFFHNLFPNFSIWQRIGGVVSSFKADVEGLLVVGSSWWSFGGVTFPVLPVTLLVHHPLSREVGSADPTAPFQPEPLWNSVSVFQKFFSHSSWQRLKEWGVCYTPTDLSA